MSRRTASPHLALVLALGAAASASAEDLGQAWGIALTVNPRLEADRLSTEAAGFDLAAARSERLPKIQTLNLPTFLTSPISIPSASGQARAAAGGQSTFVISAVAASVPIYSGGRITHTIEANRAQVNAARADEAGQAEDLKLAVARAYVGVLRGGRSLGVARSSVASLAAQSRDVANLVDSGRGIRNDLLAARVALANARQREIQLRNGLDLAWAAYNRYLCRPMGTVVPLDDLPEPPPPDASAPPEAFDELAPPPPVDEGQLRPLIERALRCRPELAGLSEQAHSEQAQGAARRAATRPQASFLVANIYQNARFLPTQADSGAASFLVSWTIFDGGKARRQSLANDRRAHAYLSQRHDLADEIVLQVRRAYLNSQETRLRVPIARQNIEQAEENLRVARNRYREQRGTNTEVLDAESSRVQSLDNYFGALYDAALAEFELRRAVGDL